MRLIHCLSLFTFLFFSPGLNAQDTVKTREVVANYPGSQEIYNVKLANPRIWHGKFRYTYGKVTMMEGSYFNDMMDGEWKYYYKSGKLKFQVVFLKGEFVKCLGGYYENGKIRCSDSISGRKEIVKIYSEQAELYRESVFFNKLWMQTTYYYPHLLKPNIVMSREQDTSMIRTIRYNKNGNVHSILISKTDLPWALGGCFDPAGKPIDQGNLNEGTGILKTYQDTDLVVLESVVQYDLQARNGPALYYFPNGKVGRRGNYLHDGYSGKWAYFKKTGKLDFERNFEVPDKHSYEKVESLPADRVLNTGNLDAEFIDGIDGLQQYLKNNVKLPKEDESRMVYGRVVLSFVINIDGIAENIKVESGFGMPKYEEELIRMVKIMPRWMPGFIDGKPRKTKFYMPVTYYQ